MQKYFAAQMVVLDCTREGLIYSSLRIESIFLDGDIALLSSFCILVDLKRSVFPEAA